MKIIKNSQPNATAISVLIAALIGGVCVNIAIAYFSLYIVENWLGGYTPTKAAIFLGVSSSMAAVARGIEKQIDSH